MCANSEGSGGCAGSPEPSLIAYVISIIISMSWLKFAFFRNKIYLYNEDYDTRVVNGETRAYTVGLEGEDRAYGLNAIDTEAKTYMVQMDRNELQKEHVTTEYHTDIRDRTYYIKADGKPHHHKNELRHDKTNKMSMRRAKTQISLGIHPV